MNKLLTKVFGTKEIVKVHNLDSDGNVTMSKRVTTKIFGNIVEVKYILQEN